MNPDRLLDTFLTMIAIDSPSRHEAMMASYCKDKLESLGFEVRFDNSQTETGSDVGNLIAHRPGTLPVHIAFSAHMDTVEPSHAIEAEVSTEAVDDHSERVIRSKGDTILAADDKSGIAAIFEGVACAIDAQKALPSITVLLSTCEEESLRGATALASDVFEGSVPCFVFDADGAPGTIIVGAPCHQSFRAVFHGCAAHAGVEPEVGNSAIAMAAAAINAMTLGRLDTATTANVGVISGGIATNIVPDTCVVEGECRSLYADRCAEVQEGLQQALLSGAHAFNGRVDVSWRQDYPAILYDEDAPIVKHLENAARSIDLTPHQATTGGGADANVLSTKGASAITLGTGMKDFHSLNESITVSDLEADARFVEAIIAEYAKEAEVCHG